MPVSLRLLDATAAGAQTLRLVTALVCSISVTTAVAGPMAYQAIEFRRSAADSTAASAATMEVPTQVVERGVLSSGAFAAEPAPSTRRPALEASTTTAVNATTTSTASTSTSGGPGGPEAPFQPSAVGPSGSPMATDVPPQVFISVPQDPAVEPAAVTAGTTPTTGAAVAPTTTAAQTDLSEFNPHPSCDDKAQELNVGTRLVCPSSPSAP